MNSLPIAIVLGALAAPAGAQSFKVLGYAGVLGEWELTATVTEHGAQQNKEFSGPLTMTHVGLCSQDGPEEKLGDMRIQLSPPKLTATLSVDGVVCTYSATMSDAYTGTMTCPDRPAVPLKLWVR